MLHMNERAYHDGDISMYSTSSSTDQFMKEKSLAALTEDERIKVECEEALGILNSYSGIFRNGSKDNSLFRNIFVNKVDATSEGKKNFSQMKKKHVCLMEC